MMKAACFLLFFVAATTALNCSVSGFSKIDCGHSGSTKQTCEASGCCWLPMDPNPDNEPWCYYDADHPQPPPAPTPQPSLNGSFTDAEISTMTGFFLKNINIQGKGGVVASPDTATKGGTYVFHWMRDGSITMGVVDNIQVPGADALMKSYLNWVTHVQSVTDPFGKDVRGEPKFFLPDGEVFSGGWCRPQIDGPGLRSSTLGQFGLRLVTAGQQDFVHQKVWPVVLKDCEFITQVWNLTPDNCDLWEEVRGEFLFTLLAERKGLLVGARLAKLMNDETNAALFTKVAGDIQTAAAKHWNGQYLVESSGRPRDSATILGVLYGYDDDDFLAYTDPKVVSTLKTLHNVFYDQFPINAVDNAAGIPGILWGRYPGDNYAGGNPWILNTAAAADLYYRQAKTIRTRIANGKQSLTDAEATAFASLLNVKKAAIMSDNEKLASDLVQLGDGILYRIREHVLPLGLHLPEQISKTDGSFANAFDLTWSYGCVLQALYSRRAAL